MFVLCVLHSKDEKAQPGQSGQSNSTDKSTENPPKKKIPPGAWMLFCCVLSGRGLCDGPIPRPEEPYRL
jgi:hypothetical protein